MPTNKCEVCDGDDFELRDGFYYCTICENIREDLVVEGHSDEEFPASGASSVTSSLMSHRIYVKKKYSKMGFGKTWTTQDAYNLILLNQVKALISLGASPQLKTVVLNLWVQYLEKTYVTYLKKKKTKRRHTSFYPRLRDIEVIVGQCSELVTKSRLLKIANNNKKKQMADFISANERTESEASDLDGHYASESDTVTDYGYLSESSIGISDVDSSVGYDSDASSKISSGISRSESEMKHMTRWALGRSVHRMNLTLTLAFLYLGLLLLHEQILLSDILCWAWEDRIPLYNTADIFPEYMKFQLFDNQTFRLQHAISHERVRLDTGHLAKFLGISEIMWNPLKYIAARFIKELNLPDVMFSMVSNLISAYPSKMLWESDRRNAVIPNYEGKAAAYIIVALKLLFGLNGRSEWIISQYSNALTKKQEVDKSIPFDFYQWRKHMSIKSWLSSHHWRRNIRAKIAKQSTDIDELIRFYVETSYKWKGKLSVDRTKKQESEHKQQTMVDALCGIFQLLSTPVLKSGNEASSFPLHSEAADVFSKLRKSSYCEFGSPEIYCLNRPDFSRTSLDFLLESPSCSVKNFESCMKTSKKAKKYLKRVKKPYSKWLTAYKKYQLTNLSARTMSKLKLHSDKTFFPLLSSTSWLVNLFTYILEMKSESIYQEVTLLENSVLKLNRRKRKRKRR